MTEFELVPVSSISKSDVIYTAMLEQIEKFQKDTASINITNDAGNDLISDSLAIGKKIKKALKKRKDEYEVDPKKEITDIKKTFEKLEIPLNNGSEIEILLTEPHSAFNCSNQCDFFAACWLMESAGHQESIDYLADNFLQEIRS